MHGVCGGAVQRRVNGGVRRVRARLSDGHTGIVGGHHVCSVQSRAVQRSVDVGVRRVGGGLGDGHVNGGRGDGVRCVWHGSVQCGVHDVVSCLQ